MRTSPQSSKDGSYRTSDLYYAAYLKVAGVSYLDEEVEGRRVFFLFENSPNIDDLKRGYYNRTAKVPAMTYCEEIKALKALTAEAQRASRRSG